MSLNILSRQQIEKVLSVSKMIEAVEQGFVLYSRGDAVIPPFASLHFDDPAGECHIKYGYVKAGKYYVVKIASGFCENPRYGFPSNQGLMLLFDQRTGRPVCILLDEGYLTEVRTAAAGCIAAKLLAPKFVSCVGIVGTGTAAYSQLKLLSLAVSCRKAMIWGRDPEKVKKLTEDPDFEEWTFETVRDLDGLQAECNLIVTTTSATQPLLFAEKLQSGTHITAIGADDIGKQELDENIFRRADRVVVDSRSQSFAFGDVSRALQKGLIGKETPIELGELLADPSLGRTSEDQITVCNLTGIAIQDLQIAQHVYETFLSCNPLSR